MTKLLYRAATGITTAALVASSFVGPAFASIDVVISGNGDNSNNTANVAVANNTTVTQSNVANIQNNVNVDASTGQNDANSNTGGDVTIDTGNATANVGVSNTANSNVADVNGCCPQNVNVTIDGNGVDSNNTANVGVSTGTWVNQNNYARVKNDVDVDAKTGKNDANRNTGGDVTVNTGNAKATVDVVNALNKNVASVGNGSGSNGSLAVVISGNGDGSDNTANVGLAATTTVFQNNIANVKNNVDVDAKTGKNDANSNTGGDVTIDTGNATANVDISNLANFNAADVDSCGCIFDGKVKVVDNGVDSDNDANVSLYGLKFVDQFNLYSCGHRHHRGNGVNSEGGDNDRACNDVDVDVATGKNDANNNTGDSDSDPSVLTGDATADVVVETTANSNVVGSADFDWDFPELPSDGTLSLSLLLWLVAFFG